jgi:membrane protein insertase Oxa1/YidC/SpoIIIJ
MILDILTAIMLGLYTIMMIVITISNLRININVPYSTLSKFATTAANIFMVSAVWTIFIFPLHIITWIFIGFAFILVLIWLRISYLQRKYLEYKLHESLKKIEQFLKEIEEKHKKKNKTQRLKGGKLKK